MKTTKDFDCVKMMRDIRERVNSEIIHNDFPPYLHNLLRLAEKCDLNLDEEQRLFFATVTAFNINARYDDYKMTFQKT